MEEGGKEEEATRACGGAATFAQHRDVMLEVMPGDEAWTRLTGAVEGFDCLLGEQSSGEELRGQPFFLESPSAARPCPTSRALTGQAIGVKVSAIADIFPSVSQRVRMMSAAISCVRIDGLRGPLRVGPRAAGLPGRTALRRS